MKLTLVVAMTTFAVSCCVSAQNKAEIFPGADVSSQLATLAQKARASGSSGATLGDYRSHAIKLSVRAASGGAEVHAHYDDIFVVTDGKATLITGGTILNAKTGSDGETTGSGIRNGRSQAIVKGDIVHIPAGTPHQLILAPGSEYSSIVIKVKE
jgi:mannose-6-phosphate isomerase-like protein (cupin superfamily)